jgi:hypothetical protein
MTDDANKLRDEIGKLRAALRPFAAAVFNDNGDMTIVPVNDRGAYVSAYFAMKHRG